MKYVFDLMTKTIKLDAKTCNAPMITNFQILKEVEPFEDPKKNRRLMRKLKYNMVTQPRIAYSITMVSQFMADLRAGRKT